MELHNSITNWKSIKTFNTLEERFNKIHNNIYNYSKSVYTKSRGKLIIICTEHGEFTKTPDEHLQGQGCPKCSKKLDADNLRFTKEQFIEKAKAVHGDKYDYSKVVYLQNKQHITIICPEHGEFEQTPHVHTQGSGCTKCRNNILTDTKDSFINKANLVHNYLYSYDKVIYSKSWNNITITCPVHGDFEQSPNNHLSGKGCKNCINCGFKYNSSAILYYLKIQYDNKTLYKIGITNRSIKERFTAKDRELITVLHQVHYKSGQDAYNEEQRILKQFKEFKYIGPDVLSSGNTELFVADIFGYNQKDMVTMPNNADLATIIDKLSTLK